MEYPNKFRLLTIYINRWALIYCKALTCTCMFLACHFRPSKHFCNVIYSFKTLFLLVGCRLWPFAEDYGHVQRRPHTTKEGKKRCQKFNQCNQFLSTMNNKAICGMHMLNFNQLKHTNKLTMRYYYNPRIKMKWYVDKNQPKICICIH